MRTREHDRGERKDAAAAAIATCRALCFALTHTQLPCALFCARFRYFACVRPAVAFDEGDGTVLGRLMFLLLHPHRQHKDLLTEKILDMIRSTNVLRSAQAKHR